MFISFLSVAALYFCSNLEIELISSPAEECLLEPVPPQSDHHQSHFPQFLLQH